MQSRLTIAVALLAAMAVAPFAARTASADPPVRVTQADQGTLGVQSSPAGRIYIDGERTREDTPLSDYVLSAGTHMVQVEYEDGTMSEEREVVITADQNTNVFFRQGREAIDPDGSGEGPDEPTEPTEPAPDMSACETQFEAARATIADAGRRAWSVDAGTWAPIAADPACLQYVLPRMGVYEPGGEAAGVRIFGIQMDSFWEALGFAEQDVIVGANDANFTSEADVAEFFVDLAEPGTYVVTILRARRERTLTLISVEAGE